MKEMNKGLYDYEDVKCFPKPSDMPPFWFEMIGVSQCDGKYHIIREDSKVCVRVYNKGFGNQPIGDIYHSLGYENTTHFSRQFKSFVGYSPAACREKFKK